MRAFLAGLLVLAAAPAAAQQPTPSRDYTEPTEPIVVTGIRIQDYRDRLAACLARHCPPNEDIDATLALTEALFLNGDYDRALESVHDGLRRNHDQARAYPEPVSDLYRADARLARHVGNDREALRSTHGILEALQEGIPQEDYRHLNARFELAALDMMMGRLQAARDELARIVRVARAAGREDVVTLAELRRMWFDWIADPHGEARQRIVEASHLTDPNRRMEATGAKILLARVYRSEGNEARADEVLAQIGRGTAARRELIVSPPYQLGQYDRGNVLDEDLDTATRSGNVLGRLAPNYRGKWIDVGFWVLPNGHVDGLEVVRRGGDASWADPLLDSIRGRVYSTAEEPTYRLERYTMTAGLEPVTGSHIRQRGPGARVEYFDLTTGDPPPPPSSPDAGVN